MTSEDEERICPACGRKLPLERDETGLTPKERAVAELVYKGLSNKEIAQRLGLSLNAVKGRVALICKAWDVQGRMKIILRMIDIKRNKSA